jgi:ankyrin repeat protein
MALKKDKQKVLGEFFDDERIKTFLINESHLVEGRDFMLLERAYRGMIAENFTTFLHFFTEAGKDINAKNYDGDTFLHSIKQHKQAKDYIRALESAGAQ